MTVELCDLIEAGHAYITVCPQDGEEIVWVEFEQGWFLFDDGDVTDGPLSTIEMLAQVNVYWTLHSEHHTPREARLR